MYAKRGCSFFCASHVTDTSDVFLSYTQTVCLAVERYASLTMFIAILHQLLRPAWMLWLFVFITTGRFFVHSWYSLSLLPFKIDSSEELYWKPCRCLCYWLHASKKVRAIWTRFSVCIAVDEWCMTAFHVNRYKFIVEVTRAQVVNCLGRVVCCVLCLVREVEYDRQNSLSSDLKRQRSQWNVNVKCTRKMESV